MFDNNCKIFYIPDTLRFFFFWIKYGVRKVCNWLHLRLRISFIYFFSCWIAWCQDRKVVRTGFQQWLENDAKDWYGELQATVHNSVEFSGSNAPNSWKFLEKYFVTFAIVLGYISDACSMYGVKVQIRRSELPVSSLLQKYLITLTVFVQCKKSIRFFLG